MTNYVIKAYYITGDSFHSEETSTELPPVWKDLDKAKKALKWLTEHYKYYQKNEDPDDFRVKHIDISDIKDKPWWTGSKDDSWHFSVNVELDDGTIVRVNIPYTGYFERLQYLQIDTTEDTEMTSYF